MATKLQLYVLVPAGYTDSAGIAQTEDRLLVVPDEFAGVDFNALAPSVRNALLNTFQRSYIDPATLGTSCNVTITPPTTGPVTPPAPIAMYGLAQLSADGVIFRVGPDATGGTTIKLVTWPVGYENFTQTYDMTPANDGPYASLGNRNTRFTKSYAQAPAGRYVARMVQGGRTYYAAVVKQINQSTQEIVLVFSDTPPGADAMLGDISWNVTTDHTASASVVASGAVEITPPRLSNASATAYVDMSSSGSSYVYATGVLASNALSYIGTYRLKGTTTEKAYSFSVPKTTILAIDRIDYNNGLDYDFRIKTSFGDGVQARLFTYGDDGSEGVFTDWFDAGAFADTNGYQYRYQGSFTARTNKPLYKVHLEFRSTTNPTVVISFDFVQATANTARRTIYAQGGTTSLTLTGAVALSKSGREDLFKPVVSTYQDSEGNWRYKVEDTATGNFPNKRYQGMGGNTYLTKDQLHALRPYLAFPAAIICTEDDNPTDQKAHATVKIYGS